MKNQWKPKFQKQENSEKSDQTIVRENNPRNLYKNNYRYGSNKVKKQFP